MNIIKKMNDGVLEIIAEGRLDTVTAPQLENEIKADIANADNVVFDFSKLDYISSAGLRVLLSANKTLVNDGKKPVTIVNANEIVKEVFDVTGFSDILNII